MLASAAQSSSDSNDGIRKLRALVDPDALALGSRAQLIDGRRYPSQGNFNCCSRRLPIVYLSTHRSHHFFCAFICTRFEVPLGDSREHFLNASGPPEVTFANFTTLEVKMDQDLALLTQTSAARSCGGTYASHTNGDV